MHARPKKQCAETTRPGRWALIKCTKHAAVAVYAAITCKSAATVYSNLVEEEDEEDEEEEVGGGGDDDGDAAADGSSTPSSPFTSKPLSLEVRWAWRLIYVDHRAPARPPTSGL